MFFASASASRAFSGLRAAAIIHMDGVGGMRGWQWICKFLLLRPAGLSSGVVIGANCFHHLSSLSGRLAHFPRRSHCLLLVTQQSWRSSRVFSAASTALPQPPQTRRRHARLRTHNFGRRLVSLHQRARLASGRTVFVLARCCIWSRILYAYDCQWIRIWSDANSVIDRTALCYSLSSLSWRGLLRRKISPSRDCGNHNPDPCAYRFLHVLLRQECGSPLHISFPCHTRCLFHLTQSHVLDAQ